MGLTYWLKESPTIRAAIHFATAFWVFQAALVLVCAALNLSQVALAVQQLVFLVAASAPAAAPAFEESLNVPASQVMVLPPHFVVSGMQHLEASVEAQVAVAQCNVAALVCFFIPAAQVKLEHLALAVQQLVFLVATSLPAAAPAFEGSWNLPASQVMVLPPHFVVSFTQHLEASVEAQVAAAQCNVAASVCFFIPAAQECVELEHLALAVQQLVFLAAASAPARVLAFEGSLNVPASQVIVFPPHFVVSGVQQSGHFAADTAAALQ
jgi:hypothetical protein